MNIILRPVTWMLCAMLLLLACSKDEDDPIVPQQPDSPQTNAAPVARAGNDTLIYKPFNTCVFDASKSTDPNNNIISYSWKFLKGPSFAYINTFDRKRGFAGKLTEVGVYEFELTVHDAGNLTSKDTVKVTVAEPACSSPVNELVLENSVWDNPWEIEIMLDPFAYLPESSHLLKVYIKSDGDTDWQYVVPLVDFDDDTNGAPAWFYHTYLSIYPGDNRVDDTPDVKIEYCE